MSTKFEFYLSEEDTDRVFILKQLQGEDKMTGNEFAKELLINTLHSQYPSTPKVDESGEYII